MWIFSKTSVRSFLGSMRNHGTVMKICWTRSGRKFSLKVFHIWFCSIHLFVTFPCYLSPEQENNELDLLESLLELKTTQQIICPICLKLPARLMKPHCVVCDCGFRFQLPSHISLKDFETSIITCSELHNMSCDSIPVFQIRPRYEVFEFYLSCEICLMTSIILETPGGTSGMDIQ